MITIVYVLSVLLAIEAEAEEPLRTIVIDIPERTLMLYVNEEPVKTYMIAVGEPSSPTPIGSFKVASIVPNPLYYNPAVGKFGPGERGNPVGTRWIGLNIKGYGIHGTNAPKSIGRAASRGCIRMHNRDAEDLSSRIKVGDVVEIKYEIANKGHIGKDIYKRYAQVHAMAAVRK